MELYLIRHAQSQNNARPEEERVEDPALSSLGEQQAALLARRLAVLEITELVVSPFLRTLQTADAVARLTSPRPRVQVNLHELGGCYSGHTPQTYCGRPGMTRAQILQRFPCYDVDPEVDERGWWKCRPREDFEQGRRRAAALLRETMHRFAGQQHRVAFVMHADFKVLLLEQIQGTMPPPPFNASVTQVVRNERMLTVTRYNCVEHLPKDLITL